MWRWPNSGDANSTGYSRRRWPYVLRTHLGNSVAREQGAPGFPATRNNPTRNDPPQRSAKCTVKHYGKAEVEPDNGGGTCLHIYRGRPYVLVEHPRVGLNRSVYSLDEVDPDGPLRAPVANIQFDVWIRERRCQRSRKRCLSSAARSNNDNSTVGSESRRRWFKRTWVWLTPWV